MTRQELEAAIAAGEVERIVFYRPFENKLARPERPEWEVFVYGKPEWHNRLTAGRGKAKGEPRIYTSLDRAHAAMRALGYTQMIEIDG